MRTSSLLFSGLWLTGCGLALGLDDYEIVDDPSAGSGGKDGGSGDGDGDGDADASGGKKATASGGADALGGADASGGDDGSGGRLSASGGAASGGSASGGAPVEPDCEDDETGALVDSGCSDMAPYCLDGSCVECTSDDDCADDGHSCSVESCVSGVCERTYHDQVCPGYGDPCLETTCGQDGCTSTDISTTIDLLEGRGDFESELGWQLTDDAVFRVPGIGTAHGGSKVAFMTEGSDDFGNASIELDVPEFTQSLTIEGFYRSYGLGTDHDNDFLWVGYWDGSQYTHLALNTRGSSSKSEVPAWTAFSDTVAFEDLPFLGVSSSTVEVNLAGWTNGGPNVRYFGVDDLRVVALICAP